MTTPTDGSRARAVDIRDEHDVLLAVALIVPPARYVAVLTSDAAAFSERPLSEEVWREIDGWAAAGDAGLPARPAPLGPAIVDALLAGYREATAHRFASIPLASTAPGELSVVAARALPGLLIARRSAA